MTMQEIERTSEESKRADASDRAVHDNLEQGRDLDTALLDSESILRAHAHEFYQVSPIKGKRATKAEVESRRNDLFNIVAKGKPITVRQAFYQTTVHNIVEKSEAIDQTLREMAPLAEIEFRRVAVTRDQIDELGLPTRSTKTSDSGSKTFGEISVELDAIDPNLLRQMVEDVITEHLPVHQFEVPKAAEEGERDIIQRLVGEAIK
jgi:hypothetical protein